jgi:alkaline phosphatase D
MNRLFALLLLGLSLGACKPTKSASKEPPKPLYEGQNLPLDRVMQTISLGSCDDQTKDQRMWAAIEQANSDLWIWLGDNIYSDTEDMQLMETNWRLQKQGLAYQAFRKKTPVIGIWDDHDYGVNDGDKNYPPKKASQQLLLDFLDVPKNAPVRKREGAYQSFTFGPAGKQVKIILLDGRYFRDELQANPLQTPRYFVNPQGDMLGQAQWKWLENELKNSTAQFNFIGCGIQMIPEEQGFEKWANFPQARQRLFELIATTKPKRAILLSGDRHVAELSKMELPNLGYPLYELTTSGLTHAYEAAGSEPNRYRMGKIVNQRNFGILKLDWLGAQPGLQIEVRGLENVLLMQEKLF